MVLIIGQTFFRTKEGLRFFIMQYRFFNNFAISKSYYCHESVEDKRMGAG
jgi:hypothetical protein